jgi:hypothetical protein
VPSAPKQDDVKPMQAKHPASIRMIAFMSHPVTCKYFIDFFEGPSSR